jgi:hypothetical protein
MPASASALKVSIERICREADLQTLTKRSIRHQLEKEYKLNLADRKDEINRIVESVIERDVSGLRPGEKTTDAAGQPRMMAIRS